MIDTKACEWLIENGGVTTRYRVYRELLQVESEAKKIENELLENDGVKKWLKLLKPETPPQHRSMAHGSFDFCLENALPKLTQLGLHAGFAQVREAVGFYFEHIKESIKNQTEMNLLSRDGLYGFFLILVVDFLVDAGFKDDFLFDYMLKSLDEMYGFIRQKSYDIYISDEERSKLTGVPKNWVNRKFIKKEILDNHGFCYPLIYDIMGMHKLYDYKNPEIDNKVDEIISYVSNDDFHNKIDDGYGILIAGPKRYNSMGWDPKYPGWFNIRECIESGGASRVLFSAQTYSKYPIAVKTRWFNELLEYLEAYKTENDTYRFPSEWIKESSAYAVGGNHLSFGENRTKKNWSEIESTLYMQFLKQKCSIM